MSMNEREQLAKDNGMTIEFVNWFFDNKKDGCGNAWFIMMAAMWEGWKVQESRCSWLAAERDALREGEMGDAKHSNTRAAADIYFQLVEECEIPAGGSLVEHIDNMRGELETANKTSEARKQGLIRAHKMFQREKARAEAAEKRLEEVRGYNVDLAEESRQYQQRVAELNDALCQLLPGVQYMDPPDGGSVTPLEQVRRMVTDYRERLKIAESRCDHRSKFWDVSGVQRCTLCDKAISSDGDQQTAELVAAGIITKVGE